MVTIKEKLGQVDYDMLVGYFKENYAKLFEEKQITKAVEEMSKKYSISATSINTQIIRPLKEQYNLRRPPKSKELKGNKISLSEQEIKKLVDFWEGQDWFSKKDFYDNLIEKNILGNRLPCRTTVDRILEKNKVSDIEKFGKENKQEQKNKVIQEFEQGRTVVEISSMLNLGKTTVEGYLRETGIVFGDHANLAFKKEVLDYYYEHGTEETEKKYGVPQNTQSRWRRELNLSPRDNSASYRKYSLDESVFEVIDTEGKAYVLGLIQTDGNIFENVLSIELHRSDVEILEKVKEVFGTNRPLYHTLHFDKRYDHYTQGIKLQITSSKLCKDLEKFGIVPRKSLVLSVNTSLLLDENMERHFWRGSVDGDGSLFVRREKSASYETLDYYGTKNMCEKFITHVESKLGIRGSIYPHHSVYRATFQRSQEAIRVSRFLYTDCSLYLSRKKDISNSWLSK